MIKISLINTKGDTGKSSTAMALAQAIAISRENVLLIDLDPSCSLSKYLGCEGLDDLNMSYMARNPQYLEKIINKTSSGIGFAAGNPDILNINEEMLDSDEKYSILADNLKPLEARYQYAIIDTAPVLNILSENAIFCADIIIVPVQAEYFSVEGTDEVLGLINKSLPDGSMCQTKILITHFENNCKLAESVCENIKEKYSKQLFETIIPTDCELFDIELEKTGNIRKNLFSRASFSFINLAKEIFKYEER